VEYRPGRTSPDYRSGQPAPDVQGCLAGRVQTSALPCPSSLVTKGVWWGLSLLLFGWCGF
jgi:hypothetical protein